MTNSGMKVWLITGASRGLGKEMVAAALEAGDAVIAGVRDIMKSNDLPTSDQLRIVQLDVTEQMQAQKAVEMAISYFGRIDVVINNAGYGLLGAVEETSAEQVRNIFATNVEGPLNIIRAVLPILRQQGSGHIINISSLGGFAASAGNGVYGASKFALEGLSEALEKEVKHFGIKVTVVEPGLFRTEFLSEKSIQFAAKQLSDYDSVINRNRAKEANGSQLGDPKKAATAIREIASLKSPPLRIPLGEDALKRVQDKLNYVGQELESYRSISLSTNLE
ncbi:oxidoreductase [Celerinatantimonas diazotrophica]|uniref:NADP-dependent 3-hydroxy acid dehydrogenase YdfG n=1 Tax=Celerinatantimonas diazotrophica TaxID=412034 RepID=A0A4R1J7L6_9GAMM|nr:oxidoreductase [Celerinatantimonas diazotrophica]TCK46494.1 NADP-dependent 3-hydroxy acid dehydrogenase YdfG [Celerinatantimonas diazotrophica]CAG9296544.1 3-phenylpropionate-dihydrodiol/cinnamic acid-dihydrodiol dehydrogenase [Celerinatantimonas diazotrophica]